MKMALIICFLFSISQAWAGEEKKPLGPGDFAYGMELSLSSKGAIYSLSLPAQVYQACTRDDLGDLRVFGRRNVVPHLLRPQAGKKDIPSPVKLPYFPLIGKSRMNTLPPGLHITTTSLGTIIDFRQSQKEQGSDMITSYIIDASGLKQKADWLELSWSGKVGHFSTTVQVDTSDDLNNWQPLIRSASLAELRFDGHDLVRNRIPLKREVKKYLRLFWPAGEQGVKLTAVMAGYAPQENNRQRMVQFLTGEQESSDGEGKVVYHYTSEGFFPVDQINIRFPRPNSLARVIVSSRAGEDEPWRQRASMLCYQLYINGSSVDSGVKNIAATTDRFWRLEMEKAGNDDQALKLELGWLPRQLVFLAEGDGPYTLAYGRGGLQPVHSQVAQLLTALDPRQNKDLVLPAHAGPQIILGGKSQLLSTPELPWRRWLLWAVLVVGVLVVGGMALHLFKEMRKEER